MAIIEINHITKEYQLGQLQSLKETLLNGLARLQGEKPIEVERFKALNDVGLKIEKGGIVSIIGHNGAGKKYLRNGHAITSHFRISDLACLCPFVNQKILTLALLELRFLSIRTNQYKPNLSAKQGSYSVPIPYLKSCHKLPPPPRVM